MKYLKNFEEFLEDDDEDDDDDELNIQDFAKDSILKRSLRIKNSQDRKKILEILKNLLEGKSLVVEDDEKKERMWHFLWIKIGVIIMK